MIIGRVCLGAPVAVLPVGSTVPACSGFRERLAAFRCFRFGVHPVGCRTLPLVSRYGCFARFGAHRTELLRSCVSCRPPPVFPLRRAPGRASGDTLAPGVGEITVESGDSLLTMMHLHGEGGEWPDESDCASQGEALGNLLAVVSVGISR